jgi:hypothetical protein
VRAWLAFVSRETCALTQLAQLEAGFVYFSGFCVA